MNIDSGLGICHKKKDKTVVYQNENCLKTCGNMQGQICTKGCMESYAPVPGMTLLKNYCVEHENAGETEVLDAVVINDQETGSLTTLLYYHNNSAEEEKQMQAQLSSYGLSKSELAIFSRVMKGAKNSEIMKEFFISKSTLKTHLNNIYKKLPEYFQQYKKRR